MGHYAQSTSRHTHTHTHTLMWVGENDRKGEAQKIRGVLCFRYQIWYHRPLHNGFRVSSEASRIL